VQLPYDERVDTGRLSACFNSTSATYKFYWFLAILEAVEEGKDRIEKRELFARMVANAWFAVNYFHVSFGPFDRLQEKIELLKSTEGLAVDARKEDVMQVLLESRQTSTVQHLKHFDTNVPHKFLSPWLGSGARPAVYALSQHGFEFAPYALYDAFVLVQPDWFTYFRRNSGILKDFCYWNLALFLQTRNPNVPDIPNKLRRPERRGSLAQHKKQFWDIVLEDLGGVRCMYTGRDLHPGTYDVEHFVPFQFVAHDQMWNLVPADPAFNSRKGDRLPVLDRYFPDFYRMQTEAVGIIREKKPHSRFLDDYVSVFKSLEISEEAYRDCIAPLLTIAHNNGFQYLGG
jgi:hypothetical protein